MGAWAQFPTKWIMQNTLRELRWKTHKSNGTAALLVLMALIFKRNLDRKRKQPQDDISIVKATYEDIQRLVSLSRSKIASGLALLTTLEIIQSVGGYRSHFRLCGIDVQGGWAKLPQEHLLQGGRMAIFEAFTLRSKSELDALKAYLLMAAFRSSKTGYAHIGYEKITDYTGVTAANLRKAKSHLISLGLIHSEFDNENALDKSKPPLRYKILGL